MNEMAFSKQKVWGKFCVRVADKAWGNKLFESICAVASFSGNIAENVLIE